MADKTDKETYLYKITNPKGRIYIGQTVNTYKRFLVYARNAIPGQHRLRSSISKYGWTAHTTEIITSFQPSEIDYAERYLIAYYNSTGKGGLNILAGGQIKKTEEQNRRHSIIMTGKVQPESQRKKRAAAMIGNKNALGTVRSQAWRDKVSATLTGYKRPDTSKYKHPRYSFRKPIICTDKEGNLIKEYAYLREVSQDGFDPSSVSRVSKNGCVYRGLFFKYK